MNTQVDVLVIGAGVAGIGAAARLGIECPDRTYAVLEARDAIGGTWDLFRYPGVRSDSDIFTFSYPFKPWQGAASLADGADIRQYIADSAREFGVEQHIRFGTKVVAAAWSSDSATWTVDTVSGPDSTPDTWTCSFLLGCTGYFDYDRGYTPSFPGLDDFEGEVVHPQFWPGDLDHTGKRVVVIGSGATAMTLVPSLAGDAAHVTMLQRSPTYVTSLPSKDVVADVLRKALPAKTAHNLIRAKNVAMTLGSYRLSRRFPVAARRVLLRGVARHLGQQVVDAHFTPAYDPWDQRLCVTPDADLMLALTRGDASIVTDHIDTFVPEGIRLASGLMLEADVVVTATGLQLQALGGLTLTVDGEPVEFAEQLAYRGMMLSGVPNFAVAVGYTNASWTLRSDLVARYVCRYLRHLTQHGLAFGVPVADPDQPRLPLMTLTSGYVTRSIHEFPCAGADAPWVVRQNYLVERRELANADLTLAMRFVSTADLAHKVASTSSTNA